MSAGDLVGGIGGAIGGAIGLATAPKGGKDQYKQSVREWELLRPSQFDMREINAPYMDLLGEMTPEEYDVAQAEGVQGVSDSPGARSAQVRSLAQLEEIGAEGMPLVDRLAAQDAHRSIMGSAQGARQAMMSNLAARGTLSGGDAIQAALGGGQQSANLARDMGSDLARESAMRRLSGIEAAGGAASNLRGQDVDLASRNAEIANRFSEMFSQQQTARNQANAGSRERAKAYNVGTRQALGNANEQARYSTATENLNRKNQLMDTLFGQQAHRAAGLSGALTSYGGAREQGRQAHIGAAQSVGQGVGQSVGGVADIYGGGLGK